MKNKSIVTDVNVVFSKIDNEKAGVLVQCWYARTFLNQKIFTTISDLEIEVYESKYRSHHCSEPSNPVFYFHIYDE